MTGGEIASSVSDEVEGAARGGTPWLAVASIAAGTFALVTTEFLPIGLLSRIAADLHVTEGVAGLSVTAPGLIAALAGPILLLLANSVDRRTVIVGLTVAIFVSNLIGAMAPTFAIFLVGRVVLGIAVGGLWTFAVAVGRRLVPESAGHRATSIISIGISAGTVFGVPVGAVFGDLVGWRIVFATNGGFALLVVLLQLRLLPAIKIDAAIRFSHLLEFGKIPMARVGLIASGVIAAGHFIAYTYLEPYLRNALKLEQTGVALVLAGYAFTGIFGSFLGERLAVYNIRRAFVISAAVLGLSVIGAILTVQTQGSAIVMVLLWGIAFGAWPVCNQIWMYASSPKLYEAGSALMVSAFQISLSAGATIGGLLVDGRGIAAAFLVGGVVAVLGTLIACLSRAPQ